MNEVRFVILGLGPHVSDGREARTVEEKRMQNGQNCNK